MVAKAYENLNIFLTMSIRCFKSWDGLAHGHATHSSRATWHCYMSDELFGLGKKSRDSLPCKADIECQVILKTYKLFVHVDVHYHSNLSWGGKNVPKISTP